MASFTIKIHAGPETDTYVRQFGLTLGELLPPDFWNSKPESVIKLNDVPFLSHQEFTITVTREIEYTIWPSVMFAPSSPSGYTWWAELWIDGEYLGKQTGICSVNPYAVTNIPAWKPWVDLNLDGMVNIRDMARVASKFGQTDGLEDFNADGKVDIRDVATISQLFGIYDEPLPVRVSAFIPATTEQSVRNAAFQAMQTASVGTSIALFGETLKKLMRRP